MCPVHSFKKIVRSLKIFYDQEIAITYGRKGIGILKIVFEKDGEILTINMYPYDFINFFWITPPNTGLNWGGDVNSYSILFFCRF